MTRNNLFEQIPSPIDIKEINWNILDIPEMHTQRNDLNYRMFEIKRTITISDLMKYIEKHEKQTEKEDLIGSFLLGLDVTVAEMNMADLKQASVIEDVENLRQEIISVFEPELKNFSGNIVQFVKTPLSFLDFASGSIAIQYRLFTERCLGVYNE